MGALGARAFLFFGRRRLRGSRGRRVRGAFKRRVRGIEGEAGGLWWLQDSDPLCRGDDLARVSRVLRVAVARVVCCVS